MHMPLKYSKNGKGLYFNKTLYGLRQSLLFWRQKLINKLKKLGFKEIA